MQPDTYQIISLIGYFLSLWLGLHLIDRKPRSTTTVAAGAAIVALGAYLGGTAVLAAPKPLSSQASFWGALLTCWVYFAPVLLLHAAVRLTGHRMPAQRAALAVAYAAGAAICVLSWGDSWIYEVADETAGQAAEPYGVRPGPLYALSVVQVVLTEVAIVAVLLRMRLSTAARSVTLRRQTDVLLAGVVVILVGTCVMFANALYDAAVPESILGLVLVAGALLVAVPLARFSGSLDGQLLRSDLRSALLAALIVLTVFVAAVLAADATTSAIMALGTLAVVILVGGADIGAFTDRLFFDSASRAQRSGLRTAAVYAGSTREIDLDTLLPGQSGDVISLMSEVDRAGLASTTLERRADVRLELLGRDEFADVRAALGLPPGWTAADGVASDSVGDAVRSLLIPRERQALGLRYMGYSDKEMARLMGVKPGVPRSYLSAGKRKLRLPAGAQLNLFVHFAGLVQSDALPLLAAKEGQSVAGGDTH